MAYIAVFPWIYTGITFHLIIDIVFGFTGRYFRKKNININSKQKRWTVRLKQYVNNVSNKVFHFWSWKKKRKQFTYHGVPYINFKQKSGMVHNIDGFLFKHFVGLIWTNWRCGFLKYCYFESAVPNVFQELIASFRKKFWFLRFDKKNCSELCGQSFSKYLVTK